MKPCTHSPVGHWSGLMHMSLCSARPRGHSQPLMQTKDVQNGGFGLSHVTGHVFIHCTCTLPPGQAGVERAVGVAIQIRSSCM